MIDKQTFKNSIGAPLEMAGFVKKGYSWYLKGNEVIVVANLEKIDMFSWEQYAINIGFWLKALGNEEYPPYNHCHMYYRLERLFPLQRELILIGCSLTQSNDQILADLSNFINNQVLPFLIDCTDESMLRDLMLKGKLHGGLVRHEAKTYLFGN